MPPRGENVEIVSYEISSPKDLQAGLKEISINADVLLAVPDQTVYSGKTAKEVLLFSYRNRIPFVGLSSFWVKAGAFTPWKLTMAILGGRLPSWLIISLLERSLDKRAVFHPEKVNYSLNIRTKDYLRLDISNDIIKGASIAFE